MITGPIITTKYVADMTAVLYALPVLSDGIHGIRNRIIAMIGRPGFPNHAQMLGFSVATIRGDQHEQRGNFISVC